MAQSVLAKMAVQISANTAEFNKNLAKSSSSLMQMGKTAQSVNTTLQAFGVGFGAYQLAGFFKDTISIMATFEQKMSEVKAITGATGREFEKLQYDALRLGASTKYTASQVAELQVAYGRLGFTTREILDATEATLNLAAATGEDLAKAADVAGSTVRGFGLDADQTIRVADVMASSFNKSALSLENFTESMKYVAPVANAAGATVEETTALLAVLADAGIRGSQAGTSLRKIFTDMTKDGRPLKERLEELGKRGITLADSFDEVGRTAQTSLLVLTKNTEKADKLTEAFKGANGEAEKMAKIMQDNLIGDTTKLTSAWEGFILQLTNSRALRSMVQTLTDLVTWMTKSNDRAKEQTAAFKDMSKVATSFIKVFGAEVGRDKSLDIWNNRLMELGEQLDAAKKKADSLGERSLQTQSVKVQNEYTEALREQTRLQNLYNDYANEGGLAIKEAYDKAINGATAAVKPVQDLTTETDKLSESAIRAASELERMGRIAAFDRSIEAKQKKPEFTDPLKKLGLPTPEEVTARMAALQASLKTGLNQIAGEFINISGLIVGGIGEIADALGEAAVTGPKDFGKKFIYALATFAQQFGGLLIATGLGEIALRSGNPALMIAGGAALIAAGAAIKALVKPSLSGGNSVGGRGSSFSGSSQQYGLATGAQNTLTAETVIRGQDLYVIFSNYQKNNKATRG